MTRRQATPETRARLSEAVKRAWADPQVRSRRSEAVKRAMADPMVRARLSEAVKRAWVKRRGFDVPAWVQRAGLEQDFRDVAALCGEEEAAAHCRALKRAMEAQTA